MFIRSVWVLTDSSLVFINCLVIYKLDFDEERLDKQTTEVSDIISDVKKIRTKLTYLWLQISVNRRHDVDHCLTIAMDIVAYR